VVGVGLEHAPCTLGLCADHATHLGGDSGSGDAGVVAPEGEEGRGIGFSCGGGVDGC
jgi:hypothetical protein